MMSWCVRNSPMLESLHKQNNEKACATGVPSYSQVIKCQEEHVTIKKGLRHLVKKKTYKPNLVITGI